MQKGDLGPEGARFWLFPVPGAVVSNHLLASHEGIIEWGLVNKMMGARLGPYSDDIETPTLVTVDLCLSPA